MIIIQNSESSIRELQTINFNRPFKPMINVTSFPDHQGLYYESHGEVRLSHLSWNLVTYLEFETLISKYSIIIAHYEATIKICDKMTENFGSVEIANTCELFI